MLCPAPALTAFPALRRGAPREPYSLAVLCLRAESAVGAGAGQGPVVTRQARVRPMSGGVRAIVGNYLGTRSGSKGSRIPRSTVFLSINISDGVRAGQSPLEHRAIPARIRARARWMSLSWNPARTCSNPAGTKFLRSMFLASPQPIAAARCLPKPLHSAG